MSNLVNKRILECNKWLMGNDPVPHWRTQEMLFKKGYIDFTPTGFTYATPKMVKLLRELEREHKIGEDDATAV